MPHNHIILVTPLRQVLIAPVVVEDAVEGGRGLVPCQGKSGRLAATEMNQVGFSGYG